MTHLGRRDLLIGGALSVGGMSCSSVKTPARRRGRTVPETSFDVTKTYPALAPLADAVFDRRRSRARELARASDADTVFVTSGTASFAYLVGGDFGRSERLIALVLPVDGDAFVLAPAFEVDRVRRRARGLAVRGWEEDEDALTKLREGLGERPITVLIEPHTDYAVAAALGRTSRDVTLLDGSTMFEELRVIKTDEEIERMRRAVTITEDAFATAFERLEVGMSEKDVARVIHGEHARRGVEGYALVQFGMSSSMPHGGPSSTTLTNETVVLIDGGCTFQGWQSDVTRTRWFGESPAARFVAIYNLVHDAQSLAIARVQPGVPAQEIDRAARGVIAREGLGRYFTHRLGHGIGMEGHEAVYMVEGNPRRLEVGMVFTIEPGIYMPGEGMGVRLEEQVVCAAKGADVLTRRAPRL